MSAPSIGILKVLGSEFDFDDLHRNNIPWKAFKKQLFEKKLKYKDEFLIENTESIMAFRVTNILTCMDS